MGDLEWMRTLRRTIQVAISHSDRQQWYPLIVFDRIEFVFVAVAVNGYSLIHLCAGRTQLCITIAHQTIIRKAAGRLIDSLTHWLTGSSRLCRRPIDWLLAFMQINGRFSWKKQAKLERSQRVTSPNLACLELSSLRPCEHAITWLRMRAYNSNQISLFSFGLNQLFGRLNSSLIGTTLSR